MIAIYVVQLYVCFLGGLKSGKNLPDKNLYFYQQ